MNFITRTTHNLTDAIRHYACIRLQFRSSVIRGDMGRATLDKRLQAYCPARPGTPCA